MNKTQAFQRHSLTQLVYWSCRALKKIIQFPSVLSVSGASRRQMPGICPLNRARATSSSSLLIPTSPAKAWKDGEILSAGLGEVQPDGSPRVAVPTYALQVSQGLCHAKDQLIKTFQFLQQHHRRRGYVSSKTFPYLVKIKHLRYFVLYILSNICNIFISTNSRTGFT